jgi:hypothetical protein
MGRTQGSLTVVPLWRSILGRSVGLGREGRRVTGSLFNARKAVHAGYGSTYPTSYRSAVVLLDVIVIPTTPVPLYWTTAFSGCNDLWRKLAAID